MPKIHITKNFIRARLKNPNYFDKRSFRTKKVTGRNDVKLIIGCKKDNFKGNKCRRSTELQAIIYKK